MTPSVLKQVRLTANLTNFTEAVFVVTPFATRSQKILVGSPVTHPTTGDNVIGWKTALQPDEDLSQKYKKKRTVSFGLDTFSSTVPSGAFAIDGRITGTTFYTNPNFALLDPTSLTAYNTDQAVQNVSVLDGIVVLGVPQGNQEYVVPQPNIIDSGGALSFSTARAHAAGDIYQWQYPDAHWTDRLSWLDGATVFNTWLGGKTQLTSAIGKIRVSLEVALRSIAVADPQLPAILRLHCQYIDDSGNYQESLAGGYMPVYLIGGPQSAGDARFSCSFSTIVDALFPIDRIMLVYDCPDSTLPVQAIDYAILTAECLENEGEGDYTPVTVFSVSGFSSAASLTLNYLENDEAVPNFELSQDLPVNTGWKPRPNTLDQEFAVAYFREGPLAKTIWSRPNYLNMIRSGELDEASSRKFLRMGYSMSWKDAKKYWKRAKQIARPIMKIAPALLNLAGRPEMASGIAAIAPIFGLSAESGAHSLQKPTLHREQSSSFGF